MWEIEFVNPKITQGLKSLKHEWIERHMLNGSYAFRITKSDKGYFTLVAFLPHIDGWAKENHHRFVGIEQNDTMKNHFETSNLGLLIDFAEEMKNNAL